LPSNVCSKDAVRTAPSGVVARSRTARPRDGVDVRDDVTGASVQQGRFERRPVGGVIDTDHSSTASSRRPRQRGHVHLVRPPGLARIDVRLELDAAGLRDVRSASLDARDADVRRSPAA
jgi:hypothetical protein